VGASIGQENPLKIDILKQAPPVRKTGGKALGKSVHDLQMIAFAIKMCDCSGGLNVKTISKRRNVWNIDM